MAEDNAFNQQVVRYFLARRGHTVQVAGDGRAALTALEQGDHDLLLLDVHMPELDGFQVIDLLRRREQGTGLHLPVIALTARSTKDDRERCLAAGMDDYLAKPIRRKELFAAIDRVLRKDEGGRMKDEQGRSSAPDSSFILHPSSFGESLLDAATLLTSCDADPVLLGQIIAVFQADAQSHLDRLGTALRDRNAAALRESAHKLRGLLSAFSGTAAEAALRLEEAGAAGQLDGAAGLYESLSGMVRQLGPLLARLSVEELQAHQATSESGANQTPGC